MKSFFINCLFLLLGITAIAQKSSDWRNFVVNDRLSVDNAFSLMVVELTAEVKELIRSGQLRVIRRVDEDHVILRQATLPEEVRGTQYVLKNEWKWQVTNEQSSMFYVVATEDFDPRGLVIQRKHGNTYLVEASSDQVKQLIKDDAIICITDDVAVPKVESRVIDMNLNPNRINKIHHEFPNLDGRGEVVSIQENKYRENDIDLLDRTIVTGLESEFVDNHADEMATIIAGAGNSFVTGRGVAKSATITSSNFFPVLPDEDAYYQDYGIATQNHSYGIPIDTAYQAEAVAFDLSAYNNPDLLHVFSSGNEGTQIIREGTYKGIRGYANLTGDIKMTKNSLVVGSVDTLGIPVSFASKGPTYDGRVKPEVVAYSVVGSSNSAALTSGVATLLQQEYRSKFNRAMPSALAKALLINGAEDVGSAGLDFATGYGSINAYRSLLALKNEQFFSGMINQGEIMQFNLSVPANAINLKVTLCWVDPPANIGDIKALINDLDLRMVGAAATVLPWVLDSSPTIEALESAAVRSEDHLNNVEQITVALPETTYTIEVEGFDVTGTQEFYLVYQYDIENTFEWDFPTGSDNMPYNGETGSYFRWSTTFVGNGSLEYSINGGLDWITLDPAVDLSKGYWRWNNPPIVGDSAKARLQIGTDQFETATFSLSAPLEVEVGFNCGDSLMLKWGEIPKAETYTILNMVENALQEIATTADTFMVLNNKSSLVDERFSIRPNLSDNLSLLPAPTFDYTLQGVGCYVFSFFQTVALDTGIYLNLQLGTTYGIEEIILQRNDVSNYVNIGTINQPETESILFLDAEPTQGYNEHRAVIHFSNGEELILSAGSSYYLTEVPIRVYPNPISGTGILDIITREFEDLNPQFELLDTHGKTILSKIVFGTQDYIQLPGLNPGIYFFRLTADGRQYNGRVLVR